MKRIRNKNHNANTYKYQTIRAIERKLYLIDLRGGKCERCGYNRNLAAFDFHHKNPLEKESGLDMRKLSNSSMKCILKEFQKCEVICANCHREGHNPNLDIIEVKKRISEFRNSTKIIELKGKPKCIDCGIDINYTYKRCRKCKSLNSRKDGRPNRNDLLKEVEQYGKVWCANKYKVARITISRWIK